MKSKGKIRDQVNACIRVPTIIHFVLQKNLPLIWTAFQNQEANELNMIKRLEKTNKENTSCTQGFFDIISFSILSKNKSLKFSFACVGELRVLGTCLFHLLIMMHSK